MIRNLRKGESGATAIEYGLIAALVAVACIVALEAMCSSLSSLSSAVNGKLDAAIAFVFRRNAGRARRARRG